MGAHFRSFLSYRYDKVVLFGEKWRTVLSKIGPPMGTIIGRTRKDGTTAYVAQILLKRKGQIVHRESQTFDRKQAARAWLARRETEICRRNCRPEQGRKAWRRDRSLRPRIRARDRPDQGPGAREDQRVRHCQSSLQRDQEPASRRIRKITEGSAADPRQLSEPSGSDLPRRSTALGLSHSICSKSRMPWWRCASLAPSPRAIRATADRRLRNSIGS